MDQLIHLLRNKKWLRSKARKTLLVDDQAICSEVGHKDNRNAEIYAQAAATCPDGSLFEYAQLNKNFAAARHTDTGNLGRSRVCLLGSFTGGALVFEDGTRITETNTWHDIDGHTPHWVEPFDGERYSIVLFNHKYVRGSRKQQN